MKFATMLLSLFVIACFGTRTNQPVHWQTLQSILIKERRFALPQSGGYEFLSDGTLCVNVSETSNGTGKCPLGIQGTWEINPEQGYLRMKKPGSNGVWIEDLFRSYRIPSGTLQTTILFARDASFPKYDDLEVALVSEKYLVLAGDPLALIGTRRRTREPDKKTK